MWVTPSNPTESGVRRKMPPPKLQELKGLTKQRRKNRWLRTRNLPRNFESLKMPGMKMLLHLIETQTTPRAKARGKNKLS